MSAAVDRMIADRMAGPVYRTWDAIAPDALALGDLTNEEALEMVFDADRLTTYGGDGAEDAKALFDEFMDDGGDNRGFAFRIAIRIVARHIQLR